MTTSELLLQGVQLAILGMGTVFIILCVLIFGIQLMAKVAPASDAPSPASSKHLPLSSATHTGLKPVSDQHRQAIALAIQKHRSKFRSSQTHSAKAAES